MGNVSERSDEKSHRDRGTGSLRLRGGVYQVRYWHNGKKVEESTHTGDLGKAKKYLRDRLRTANTPAFIGPQAEKITFTDLKAGILHDYTDARLQEGAQPATINRELSALRRMFKLAVKKKLLPSAADITLLKED